MELTAERLRELLDYNHETGVFTRKIVTNNSSKVGQEAGSLNNQGYHHIMVNKTLYKSHRLAWLYTYGYWPKHQLGHINRNRADNRIANLREAPGSINNHNCKLRLDNKSGTAGVFLRADCQKWVANIVHNRKRISLGVFILLDDAIKARLAAEIKYWGSNRNPT